MEETYNFTEYNCITNNKPLYVGYSVVLIVELILALPLNISVLYMFIFKLRFWKAKSNMVFLFNLMLADFVLLICLPVKIYHFQQGERCSKNDTECKVMLFMLFLNRAASIAFLTVICIDRYISVVHPRKRNILQVLKQSPKISFLIWFLLLPLTVPTMLRTFECGATYSPDKDDKIDELREIIFFTQIFIPFFILVFCTACIVKRLQRKSVGDRGKLRRAVFAVTSVVVVFSICFLPRAASRIAVLIIWHQDHSITQEIAAQVYDGIMCFSHIDCLLDPLIYCFCSSKFKNTYLSTIFPYFQKKVKDSEES
ncbi:12-(S)-hydroxy-5,8,10,14-eicosatetraenoic acid receptor [Paramormyrops kingsleyae]|uniref:G protein-coupled receptor 31 n=1 Tax=Paramormyrops kingsleyae TaxID=1676925 RepID=A0A3B3T0B2_9TELE|nr:12-(S)-hydroxy-5,8,10,14-eicosatetraenoic acid receptor [Paramormyrops kingsleyae]